MPRRPPPRTVAGAGYHRSEARNSRGALAAEAYYSDNTPIGKAIWKVGAMFENPVAKRTAIAAGIGALIAIPVPFVGPIFGALVGAGYGFFTARPQH